MPTIAQRVIVSIESTTQCGSCRDRYDQHYKTFAEPPVYGCSVRSDHGYDGQSFCDCKGFAALVSPEMLREGE